MFAIHLLPFQVAFPQAVILSSLTPVVLHITSALYELDVGYDEDDIPQELRGLIAAQFVNKYHRPTMIGKTNEEGFFRGSIRGNDSFEEVPDFKKFLNESELMEYLAG